MKSLLLAAVLVRGISVSSVDQGIVTEHGQLCAVSPTMAYTAAHVIDGAGELRWGTELAGGTLEVLAVDTKADLARVKTVGHQTFPWWHLMGEEPAVASVLNVTGTRVYAAGWYVTTHFYLGRRADGFITYQLVGHGGQSGACVQNLEGRAVGVHLGGIRFSADSASIARGWPLWKLPKEVK